MSEAHPPIDLVFDSGIYYDLSIRFVVDLYGLCKFYMEIQWGEDMDKIENTVLKLTKLIDNDNVEFQKYLKVKLAFLDPEAFRRCESRFYLTDDVSFSLTRLIIKEKLIEIVHMCPKFSQGVRGDMDQGTLEEIKKMIADRFPPQEPTPMP